MNLSADKLYARTSIAISISLSYDCGVTESLKKRENVLLTTNRESDPYFHFTTTLKVVLDLLSIR